jgi:hypothetical protein
MRDLESLDKKENLDCLEWMAYQAFLEKVGFLDLLVQMVFLV